MRLPDSRWGHPNRFRYAQHQPSLSHAVLQPANEEQRVEAPDHRGSPHETDTGRHGPRHERRDQKGEHGREQRCGEPAAGTNPRSVITEWSRDKRDTYRIYLLEFYRAQTPQPFNYAKRRL